ncbi:unnamed protein product [Urochloa humidicola]
MEGGALSGGEGKEAAAMPTAPMTQVVRRKPNFADHLFQFCMKSAIGLGSCYFVLLSYIALSNPHLEKLRLLPFFGVAVMCLCMQQL